MQAVTLPTIGTDTAWRNAARALLAARTPPEEVLWHFGEAAPQLFDAAPVTPTDAAPITVPASFVALADTVVWHSDPERFARLYALLWRLPNTPGLMTDRGDPALARLRALEKNVQRCKHKMKAFVRFRDIGPADQPRRRFAAWFEPTHHTVEPTAPFFARRFADMDWMIATPDVTARFENGALSFAAGLPRPDLPEDATEELWGTYFCNIFNPARVKVSAMTSEMPRKYWKNLPEAKHIHGLLAGAEARVREMQDKGPSLPPARAAKILQQLHAPALAQTLDDLRARAEAESRTTLPNRGRIVLGEGPANARLMIVGEQPGDIEDQLGRPFTGPAGQLFDRVAQEAGLDRSEAYVTNAVKRFGFTQRGKRRIHQAPERSDIEHARWWIDSEIRIVQPALILAMGATAAKMLTGNGAGILARRGRIEETPAGPVFLTVHPSYLLRLPDPAQAQDETARFRDDLAAVRALMAA